VTVKFRLGFTRRANSCAICTSLQYRHGTISMSSVVWV